MLNTFFYVHAFLKVSFMWHVMPGAATKNTGQREGIIYHNCKTAYVS